MKSRILLFIVALTLGCVSFAHQEEIVINQKPREMSANESLKIVDLAFPATKYFADVVVKNQIVLHHTASGKGVDGDVNMFMKPGRIATHFIIGSDTIYQLFEEQYWAYHLGIKQSVFKNLKLPILNLNKTSIGIEIDNWGKLMEINGEFRAWPNDYGRGSQMRKGKPIKVVLDTNEVVEYAKPFRGSQYYQKYTDFQLKATSNLIKQLASKHSIPLNYNEDMWDVSLNALKNKPGIYTHVSYRSDKSDCHPQPELINMLKRLV